MHLHYFNNEKRSIHGTVAKCQQLDNHSIKRPYNFRSKPKRQTSNLRNRTKKLINSSDSFLLNARGQLTHYTYCNYNVFIASSSSAWLYALFQPSSRCTLIFHSRPNRTFLHTRQSSRSNSN